MTGSVRGLRCTKGEIMGTNYYLHNRPPCACCGRSYPPLHIGKSSAGWCFALHVIPEEGINDLDDWRKLWLQPGVHIKDDCGVDVTTFQMEEVITNRYWPYRKFDDSLLLRRGGYLTEEEFHRQNCSQHGPNGLLRHAINGRCVAHGAGTWDCIRGEFS